MSNVRSLVLASKSHAASSVRVEVVLHETHVSRGNLSMPTVEGQSIEGAPRRRAAPGSQSVKVAAGAATGRQTKRGANAGIEGTAPSRANETPGRVRVPPPKVSRQPRPCAKAQRLRTSHATEGVGASAHARHASATHCHTITRPTLVASEHNGHVRGKFGAFLRQEPNPSIERTFQRPLRALWPAAHVER